MTRRKIACSKWTIVLLVVFCQYVYSRPQDTSTSSVISDSTTSSVQTEKTTQNITRNDTEKSPELFGKTEKPLQLPTTADSSRKYVKNKAPVIESIKMVANQLLENPSNTSVDTPIVPDTRIPPKLKNQLSKNKIKTRHEDQDVHVENSHAGIAVPVTMEELEKENKITESSTTNEGLSTWILLSNPSNKNNATVSTEPTKVDDVPKKHKPLASKNKSKRPQNNKVPIAKRPIIGSTNKSDLVAGGSAINENVYNKIKDTVLSNVEKNKNSQTQRPTTISSTTTTTEASTTKKEIVTKTTVSPTPVIKVTPKPTKKKNKNKQKISTTVSPMTNESALLPMEPKEQEIELEISTPATTTKKPKRSSTRKKNKTKKRKTKPKTEETSISEVKVSNKTKSNKNSKKPSNLTGPITTQIYNYLSREVMPSVGVGVLGLAGLVGIASYFLYPFAAPVRRTFEVDKKDDIYRHNAEEYANEGNGQAEEEMLGTVLAGMPAHSKQKLNPYAAQTTHTNRYPVKKEQDIRYRQVATKYDPKYNARYPQQKTGLAHAAVYLETVNYSPQYETRHVYTTEGKYSYEKASSYAPYPAVEPIYTAPHTGSSGVSSYGNDASNSVVYGIKPSPDTDFKPVYPYESQFYSETTNSPITYPPTSMYLGSNEDTVQSQDNKYTETENGNNGDVDNKFVVGNVPKELAETATPVVVPEHGPRKLTRRKRQSIRRKRSITKSIEEILKAAKVNNSDIFISNEIDEALGLPTKNLAPVTEAIPIINDVTKPPVQKNIFPVYAVSADPEKEGTTISNDITTTIKTDFIESVSTIPIDNSREQKTTTESEMSNELDATTKAFRVYEVFSSPNPTVVTEKSSPIVSKDVQKSETTTVKSLITETTTETKSETTSTLPPLSPLTETKSPETTITSIVRPRPTLKPEVITYPPLNQDGGGFFTFLKRLVEFKYRLGLSILQSTSDSLNRYLRSMEDSMKRVAKASAKA